MPSPIGHALGGVIAALVVAPIASRATGAHLQSGHSWLSVLRLPRAWQPVLGWCAAAACLPDIDFAWGRHNMETHSVGFALLLALVSYGGQRSARTAGAVFLAVCTHAFFDWLGSDDMAPLGVMALWPFSTHFYYADAWIFGAISRRYWRDDFVSQNVLAVLRELALLIPVVAVVTWWRLRRSRQG